VLALTRSAESAAQAEEPFPVIACDITDRAALAALAAKHVGTVIHCASSGRGGTEVYRHVYLEGARNLAEVLKPRQLVFTSSTSVYSQIGGEWVTEESPAEPLRETGLILRETEEVVLAHHGTVTRLAGIYGPGRSVLLRKFFAGEAVIEGDGGRWINQAHRDDISAGLFTMVEQNARGIFNMTDNQPLQQGALCEWLAERFARPLPSSGPLQPNRKRGWTNKRVSNAKLRALGWEPRYPSFFDAVANDPHLLHLQ
jgi:nucleoside-diphosphate-sugar epimerase